MYLHTRTDMAKILMGPECVHTYPCTYINLYTPAYIHAYIHIRADKAKKRVGATYAHTYPCIYIN